MEKLIVTASNSGDMSVGIPPLSAKITIEANVGMQDIWNDINYKDNLTIFKKDIIALLSWLDDMECYIEDIKVENGGGK